MKPYKHIRVTKYSGEEVDYQPDKLISSLLRSGVDDKIAKDIERRIRLLLYPGITTKKLYQLAFSMLRSEKPPNAARYKLKKAILELGPSGFPFEKFVGAILRAEGYKAEVGQLVKGHCVQHEVDVIAQKSDKHFMIECKFHSDQRRKCDVKIPLYIHSRFLDIEKAWKAEPGHGRRFHQGWLVTNTRFTTDAIQYGSCSGMYLLSWDYPLEFSLKDRINKSGLHPLTCLTRLNKKEKELLLGKGIVLCKTICENDQILDQIGVRPIRKKKVLEEATLLCASGIQ